MPLCTEREEEEEVVEESLEILGCYPTEAGPSFTLTQRHLFVPRCLRFNVKGTAHADPNGSIWGHIDGNTDYLGVCRPQ